MLFFNRFVTLLLFLVSLQGCVTQTPIRQAQINQPDHIKIGLSHEQKGEWDLALHEYTLASQANPLGNFYVGNLLFQQNKLEEAEKQYRTALHSVHDNSALFNNLAWLLFTRKIKLDEAQELAELAVKLSQPDHFAEYWDTFEQIRQYREERNK